VKPRRSLVVAFTDILPTSPSNNSATRAIIAGACGVTDRWPNMRCALPAAALMRYPCRMAHPGPIIDDDEDAAETQALAAAVAVAEADPRRVPHEEVRAWLMRLAQGEFDAPPPLPL